MMNRLFINDIEVRQYKFRTGRGNKKCGKGNNGQRSRSGFSQSPLFQGGQFRLYQSIPKRGFKSKNKVHAIHLHQLLNKLLPGKVYNDSIELENHLKQINLDPSLSIVHTSLWRKNSTYNIKVIRSPTLSKEESDKVLKVITSYFSFDKQITFFKIDSSSEITEIISDTN